MRSKRSSHARHRMPYAAAYRMRRRLSARCPESLQAGIATLRHRSAISAMRSGVVESFGGLTQPNRVKSGSEADAVRGEPAGARVRVARGLAPAPVRDAAAYGACSRAAADASESAPAPPA